MFFVRGRNRTGLAGAFVEGLVVDALFSYIRMKNAQFTTGSGTRYEAEWEIYTDVLSRFLGVDAMELRSKLIEERESGRDMRLCSDRIFLWAYRKAHPW